MTMVSSFLGGPPDEEEYTNGVKLEALLPGMLLGPANGTRSFTDVVRDRCMDFLDGNWELLYNNIQYRRPRILKSLTPMDEEERMRQLVEHARQIGDFGRMAKALEHPFDPPPPISSVDPLLTYKKLLPRPGDPIDPEDENSKLRPPLPSEVRASGTTAPSKTLEEYREAAVATKNKDRASGPSGESFRVWFLFLSLADEHAQLFADLANYCVQNRVSPDARNLIVARLGGLVSKPGQCSDEVGRRPIAIGNCDVCSFTIQYVRDITKAFLKVQRDEGVARVQLGVGVPKGCPKAATDLNMAFEEVGAVCQKVDMVAAFQSADRAPTYKHILESQPALRKYASLWFFFYGLASVILLVTSAFAAGYLALWSFVGVAQGCTLAPFFSR